MNWSVCAQKNAHNSNNGTTTYVAIWKLINVVLNQIVKQYNFFQISCGIGLLIIIIIGSKSHTKNKLFDFEPITIVLQCLFFGPKLFTTNRNIDLVVRYMLFCCNLFHQGWSPNNIFLPFIILPNENNKLQQNFLPLSYFG